MVWFWVWVFSLIGGAWHFVTIDGQRRRLLMRRQKLEESLDLRDGIVESLEKTVKELQAQVGRRDKDVSDVRATLSKRDAELKNLRDAAIRREAVIQGLQSELAESRQKLSGTQARAGQLQKELDDLRAVHIASEAAKVDTARLRQEIAELQELRDKELRRAAEEKSRQTKWRSEQLRRLREARRNMLAAVGGIEAAHGGFPVRDTVDDDLNEEHAQQVDPSEFIDGEDSGSELLTGFPITPMRMADGTTKPFSLVKGGDIVWGDRRVCAIGRFDDGRIHIRVTAKGE